MLKTLPLLRLLPRPAHLCDWQHRLVKREMIVNLWYSSNNLDRDEKTMAIGEPAVMSPITTLAVTAGLITSNTEKFLR